MATESGHTGEAGRAAGVHLDGAVFRRRKQHRHAGHGRNLQGGHGVVVAIHALSRPLITRITLSPLERCGASHTLSETHPDFEFRGRVQVPALDHPYRYLRGRTWVCARRRIAAEKELLVDEEASNLGTGTQIEERRVRERGVHTLHADE